MNSTQSLSSLEQGDPHAASQLLPLVYDELRKRAAQRMAQVPSSNLQGEKKCEARWILHAVVPSASSRTGRCAWRVGQRVRESTPGPRASAVEPTRVPSDSGSNSGQAVYATRLGAVALAVW